MGNSPGEQVSPLPFEPINQRDSVKTIVADVLRRRGAGELISDVDVLVAHPELSDGLKRELEVAGQIRLALLSAHRAGPVHEKLRLLTDSEIDSEIEQDAMLRELPREEREIRPRIHGYFLAEEISRGGQATVYKAVQESTRRTVAIKVIAGGPFLGFRQRVRFEREAEVLATLDHPNVVSIIERGRTPDGSFYFVMPFIDGRPLDVYWTEEIPRDNQGTRRTVQLFAKIAAAVEAAHGRGVVHRDLKPSNIRVDRHGQPHVLDFGLARPAGEGERLPSQTLTMPGQIIGSVPWASPEQAAGHSAELNIRSDVYSLGVILYQSLTGEFPYSLDGLIDQVLLRIRTTPASPPSKQPNVRSGVDRQLDAIVLKSLAKLPQDRYESAGELAMDLEAWLAGRPTIAVPTRPNRRRILITLAGVFVLCCVVAAAAAWKVMVATPPAIIQLPTMRNWVGMDFVRIPVGQFMFGSPDTEPGRGPDEHQRSTSIHAPFWIATTVVTQDQYKSVMTQNPSDPRWLGPTMPVENVSWNDAMDFCRRLGNKDGHRYRLPTEIEWEYTCRANTDGPFNGVWQPQRLGWYADNSGGSIHPVKEKWPNAWGLYDMHGNVSQWCLDSYLPDVSDATTEVSTIYDRVVRGGSALAPMIECRSASRSKPESPAHFFPTLGFRVLCDD